MTEHIDGKEQEKSDGSLLLQVLAWPYTKTYDVFKLVGVMCHISIVIFLPYRFGVVGAEGAATTVLVSVGIVMLYVASWAAGRILEIRHARQYAEYRERLESRIAAERARDTE